MKIKLAKFALRISLIYVLIGIIWILFSGWVLSALVSNPEIRARLEIYKGWGFVAVTALFLYLLLRGHLWQWEREVTERKRAEEASRNSERLLRSVMDLVPHFIFVKDKQSRHLLVNRACADACKLTPEQMVGRSDLDLSPGSALAKAYMKDDQEVIASGRPKFVPEEKLTDAFGQTRFLQTTKIPFPSSAISSPVAGNGEPAILGVAVDITERRKAEDALRENHARLTEALQIARLAYWEYDVASDQFTFNDQFYSVLRTTAKREGGYTMSAAEYAKRFVHPDDMAVVGAEIQQALATTDLNYSRQLDHRIIYRDGEVGYISVHIRVEKDAQGRTVRTHGANMDITERKRAELQLAESRNYLSKVINSITDPIFVKDRQHRWVLLNEAFCDFMGRQRSALLGKSDRDFFPKHEADVFWAKDELVFSTGTENVNEEKFTDGKGTARTILTKKVLYTDDKGEQFILGIIRDITERTQAEQTLQMFQFSIDQASDAIFWMNPDASFSYVNEQACRSLGYTREELMQLRLWDIDPVFPKERWDTEWKQFRENKQGGIQQAESFHRRKDGSTFPVSISSKHLWFGDTELHVAVSRDVSERKQAEEKLVYEQELFQSLLETTPDNIYFKDRESRLVRFSRSKAEDTLQAVRENYRTTHPEAAPNQWPPHLAGPEPFAQWLIGKTDFDTYPEAHAHVAYEDEQEIIRTGQRLTGKLEKATLPDGKEIWWLTTKLPWRDKDGNIIGTFGVSKDVTALKEAEAKLNQERLLLRAVIDNLPDFIYAKDKQGHFVLNNLIHAKALGAESPQAMLGKTDFDYFPQEPAKQFFADEQRIIESQQPLLNQEQHYAANGSSEGQRWYSASKVLWRDDQGNILGTVGITRDITERKQAEETFATQQQLLDSLIGAIPDLIYFKDREGRFIRINEAYAKRAGLPDIHAAAGKTDFDIFGEQHARQAYEDEQRIVATGQPMINKEEREDWADGRITWATSTKLPLLDSNGKIIGTMGISRDITDRKHAEEELYQLNRSLQTLSKCNEALVRAADEISLLKKICQIITEIGGYSLAWVGYAEQDRAKSVRPVAWVGVEEAYLKNLQVTWADTERGRGPVGTAIRTGQPSIFLNLAENPDFAPWQEDARHHGLAACVGLPLKADAKTFGVLAVYSHRPDAFNATETALLKELADDLAFGIATLRNRAERKQLEEQLRQSQKMEAIGQLAGGVAHDFNNMLTVIQGNAGMLLNPQLNEGERSESVQQVVRAAERAASLTRQLLLFSRKQVMQAVPLSLNEVVGNMTKMLQRILGEDISLNANYAANLPTVLADPGMIEQILLNLAVNSRDAMPNGGQLTITTSAETLDKSQAEKHAGATPGLYACLNITDTGCGIPPETLPRIFEPFFTTKAVGKGTGLGLATVYGIIQQHHGWIAVNSQAGQGTAFRIHLPAAKGSFPKSPSTAALSKLPGGNETILLVEDEPPVRLLASNLLQRCGYTVLVAESGVAALPIWKEHREKIHLLLTDMVMPEGISGRQLAETLKADRPELKVIYTSGYSADIIGKEPKWVDGANFLQKPYHPLKLAQIIRNCLDQKPELS